ncbi:uncharacterized protein EHS24_007900 [Apiotrichum porosum]|uniref:Uncharacterized protein n=1 Tax=Apiotrichum porosum TaxID=105984 RepID=A0A427XS19_9TREE|nr:uncharacterized protein EHS24_007900 [Apiotrichum porosum]RSH81712.1 hypothetical protein EHS24_007900 [Apiotrichum porosum]
MAAQMLQPVSLVPATDIVGHAKVEKWRTQNEVHRTAAGHCTTLVDFPNVSGKSNTERLLNAEEMALLETTDLKMHGVREVASDPLGHLVH